MQSIKERDAFSRRLKEALKRIGDDGGSPTRLAREFNRRYAGQPVTLHAARKGSTATPSPPRTNCACWPTGWASAWTGYVSAKAPAARRPTGAKEGAEPVDYELARAIGALSPAHRDAVRALVKALKRGEVAVEK